MYKNVFTDIILSSNMNETVFDENETSNKKVVSQREISTAVSTLGAFLQVCDNMRQVIISLMITNK